MLWSAEHQNPEEEQREPQESTQKIHDDGVAQQEGEAHQNPGKKRCLEIQQPEEIHADVGVPPAPDIHQHDGEGLAQEHQTDKNPEDLTLR